MRGRAEVGGQEPLHEARLGQLGGELRRAQLLHALHHLDQPRRGGRRAAVGLQELEGQGVQGISDLVTLPGIINLDFADVRTIMSDAGTALLGIGMGTGEQRAIEAAEQAAASPLLETSIDGARSILLSITGGEDLSLWEINEAAKAVAEAAHPDATIIFGAMVDENLDDQVWVTVVATRYGETRRPSSRRRLEEPAGEPRVERRREGGRNTLKTGTGVDTLDVPEFVPRG
ncbi:MAG: hypothetical protein ACKOK7_03935 [Solirubrobacterales bacterium]